MAGHAHRRSHWRRLASGRWQGKSDRRHTVACARRADGRRQDFRTDQGDGRHDPRRAHPRGRDVPGRDRLRHGRDLRRPVVAGVRKDVRRLDPAALGRALLSRHRGDRGRDPGPSRDARPGRLRLFQGRGRRAGDGRLRARRQALGHGRDSRELRVPAAARRPRAVRNTHGERARARACARDRADPHDGQRARELHAGQQFSPRRDARGPRPVCRGGLQFGRHRVGGRRRTRARRVDGRGRGDAGSLARGHPPLRALQRQSVMAQGAREGDARPALRHGLAEPGARHSAAVPGLAAS